MGYERPAQCRARETYLLGRERDGSGHPGLGKMPMTWLQRITPSSASNYGSRIRSGAQARACTSVGIGNVRSAISGTRLFRGSLVVGLVSTLSLTGCVLHRVHRVEVISDRQPQLVAAARANDLKLFGDLDGRNMSSTSRAATALKQHTFTETGADFDADVDASGTSLVFASTRHNERPNLYFKAVDGVAVTQLTSDPASDIQPAFSPDGTRVAFASDRAGTWDIWIQPIAGGPPIQITDSAADEIHPSWSPDGAQLVYSSLPAEGGPWELWIADAAAGGVKRFIGYGLFPHWSPTSNTIVYQRARDRGLRWFSIWTLTLIDGEPRYPTEVASSAHEAMILPSWSHDGMYLAFSTAPLPDAERMVGEGSSTVGTWGQSSNVFDIWVMRADGRDKVRLTDGQSRNFGPVFAPNGRIYFTSDRNGFENLWSVHPGRVGGDEGIDVTRGGVTSRTSATNGRKTATQAGLVKDGL
jgi:TolB protein